MDDIEFTKTLEKAKQTSQEAFASILKYFKPQIYSFVLSRYHVSIRDDAFQEASIRLHQFIPTFPGNIKSQLFSVFATIVNRECWRILKKKKYKDESSLDKMENENGLYIAIETTLDIEAVENDEILEKVYKFIENKCSEIDKKRFYLKRLGFNNEKICRILGIPSKEVQLIYQSVYRINSIVVEYLKSLGYYYN